jgi:hypothetical protein
MDDNLEQIARATTLAWGRIKKSEGRLYGEYMIVGEGLMEGRRWAMHVAGVNKPEGKGYVLAFAEWLKRCKLEDMDKSDRAKLLQLMEERPAVEEWRATLSDHERRAFNNPTIVWRKWTAATKVKKPKSRTANVSGSEYARAQRKIEEQQERINELEEEAAAAREAQENAGFADLQPRLLALLKKMSKPERLHAFSDLAKPFADIKVSGHVASFKIG